MAVVPACGGGGAPPATADDAGTDNRGPVEDGSDAAGPDGDAGAAEPSNVETGDADGGGDTPSSEPSNMNNNQDYEISERDCRALSAAYARSWRNDEFAKVPDGMAAADRDKAQADIEAGSAEMKDQYLGQCLGTVGTAYPLNNLKCALKAKSMKRFDDCMSGQAR